MSNETTPPVPVGEGFLRKFLNKFSVSRDKGLRDLENVIETHQAQNPQDDLGQETRSMMRNLIKFSDLRVDDAMVPRADIIAIEDSATMRELLAKFNEANHSRLPVYRETLDDIAGMIHVKDFMRWMSVRGAKPKAKNPGITISAKDLALTVKQSGLYREVLFVPPSMPAADLLVKMQATHIHMAIVIDEYGGSDGLISIEDLVEEIVGDISDEHDTEDEQLIKRQDDNIYVADARVHISVVDKLLGVDLLSDEEEDEADTLGGLIFEMAGRVPARGEIIKHDSGLEFEILQSDARRVKRIRIHVRKQPNSEDSAEEASG
ncbi:MAG TPA: hemolysin family protein [Aestuariivirga sp.]|nr:hemolysin family protein [Aestuariivirga sp.]